MQQRILLWIKNSSTKFYHSPRQPAVTLHFVDFDGTLLDDQRRFEVDPNLRQHRWDLAYYYIVENYSKNRDEDEAFANFIALLAPRDYLLDGYTHFYNPKNPHHAILTAGNKKFQQMKIDATWLAPHPDNIILVEDAHEKPRAMLQYFLRIGYIPWKIRFFDDRIKNFSGIDTEISNLIGLDVSFYRAFPHLEDKTVRVEKVTRKRIDWVFH